MAAQSLTCSIPDCNSPNDRRGWCAKHYTRWYRHGDPLAFHGTTPQKCAVLSCNNRSRVRGWCRKHHARWKTHGNPAYSPARDHGMSKAEVMAYELSRAIPDNGCLITKAALTGAGYGAVTLRGQLVALHRLSLETRLGRSLQKGEQANHTCHRRACINPDHLYAGTQQDNIRDRDMARRTAKGPRR